MNWEHRLQELRTLEPNWDSYGAAPPNEVALSAAEECLSGLGNSPYLKRVEPSAAGGVGITFSKHPDSERDCCFEFANTGSRLFVMADKPDIMVYKMGQGVWNWDSIRKLIEAWLDLDILLKNPEIK